MPKKPIRKGNKISIPKKNDSKPSSLKGDSKEIKKEKNNLKDSVNIVKNILPKAQWPVQLIEAANTHLQSIEAHNISEELSNETPISEIEYKQLVMEDKIPNDKNIQKTTEVSESINRSTNDYQNQIEALLFASGKYMEEETLSILTGIDKRTLRKALDDLRRDYDLRNSALAIFQEDKSWKINVREKYVFLVRKIVSETELNRSSMETLAVIAWKTPVYQSEVVKIRGNKCYDHIDELEQAGFVTKEKKGRSFILKTTDKFLNYFDIDKTNLQGVLGTAKMPVVAEQKTLEASTSQIIPPETVNKIEAIALRKRTETDEEKDAYQNFLNDMEKKLEEIKEKNNSLEIPKPAYQQDERNDSSLNYANHISDASQSEISETMPQSDLPIELPSQEPRSDISPMSEENIISVEKRKSLTKKQLEKKFKDDILKVREKMKK